MEIQNLKWERVGVWAEKVLQVLKSEFARKEIEAF